MNIWKGSVNKYERIFADGELDQFIGISDVAVCWKQNNPHLPGIGKRVKQRGLLGNGVLTDVDRKFHLIIGTEIVDTGKNGMGIMGENGWHNQGNSYVLLKRGQHIIRFDVASDKVPTAMDIGDVPFFDQCFIGVSDGFSAGIEVRSQHPLTWHFVIGNFGIAADDFQ